MPRQARQKSLSTIYHAVVKGVDGQLLFEEHRDFLKYLDILKYQKSKCGFELFAYCLMSNHVHLLIRANTTPIDNIFRRINTTYSNWFNMKYKRTGPLQDGRFYSEPIETQDYLLAALRYIHLNPLKANLEESIGLSYPWNSYHDYVNNKCTLVDISFILNQFGDVEQLINFHNSSATSEFLDIDKIRKRLSDDVAIDIIKETCMVTFPTEVAKFDLINRSLSINELYKKGLSATQIHRLTGISRGVVNRILQK